MAVYLVCEGFLQGLDWRVLQALVIQRHNLSVLIEPAGGAKGHRAVRAYLESRSPTNDVAIAIQDRDWQPRATADATWTNLTGRSFIWRRHEIENYLLHPRAVVELFDDFRNAGAAWASRLPTTEPDTSTLLQALASPLLEEHAAEVLRSEFVQQINGIGSLSFGPQRPSPPAGLHVCGQAQWLSALQQEASRLCQTCSKVAVAAQLQPAVVATRYSAHLATVQAPAFLTSGDYLIDMAGRQIIASLSRHVHALGAPSSLDQEAMADELLRVLERVYQPTTLFQPDDFVELAAILRQY